MFVMKHCADPTHPKQEEAGHVCNLPAAFICHPTESEATTMPVQSDFYHENNDFACLSEVARSLLIAAGPQNIETVRDDILRKVAECAAMARKKENTTYSESEPNEALAD